MLFAKRLLSALTICILTTPQITAQGQTNASIDELQTEMYRLFYTEDSLQFREVVNQLKEECVKAKNDEVFYKAWGNDAIYESQHKRRTQALEIAREMEKYAESQRNVFGQYTAIHVLGSVYHQMRDYDTAEETFKRAISFLHQNAPDKSAAADYIELTLIAVNGRSDLPKGMSYLELALKEPGISAQHRMRVLTMLCQIEGEKPDPDKEVFNKYYEERRQARAGTPADRAENAVNLLYYFVNGDYEKAMELADQLSTPDQVIFEKGRILHKLGRDHEAYLYMLRYKSVKDSMNRAERQGLLSDYIVQLNNERLEAQNRALEQKVEHLIIAIIFIVAAIFITLLVWIIWRRVKLTRKLKSDNKKLDEARKKETEARHQAEKELDIKREFVNNIAQELRSPLNPITGFSDILATTEYELAPEEREMMSQHIKESSKTLTGIIDHMIELSFYESKKTLPKEDVFAPNVLCQNAIDHTRALLKNGVDLQFRSELPDDFNIQSDIQGVGKVLRQLLNNSAKFTEKGGILLYCSQVKDRIRFIVTDTGCGIAPEQQEHIFEPIVQSGTDVKSTGMGLAICSCITKLLNGTLVHDPSYKKGCRFIFEIPQK